MSASEFAEWQAYARIDPFGEEREDQRAGVIAAVIANVHRDPKKRKDPFDWEWFLRPKDKPKEPQTWQQMLTIALVSAEVYGHKDMRQQDAA